MNGSDKERIRNWVRLHSDSIEFLEALDIWTEIPPEVLEIRDSHELAGDIMGNLQQRHRKKNARGAVDTVMEDTQQFLESSNADDVVRIASAALQEFGRIALMDSLLEQIRANRNLEKALGVVLGYLEDKDLWSYFIGKRDRNRLDDLFEDAEIDFEFEKLIETGVFYEIRLSEDIGRLITRYVLTDHAERILDEIYEGHSLFDLFECSCCEARFGLFRDLAHHQEECDTNHEHQELSWMCSRCGHSFSSQEEAMRHSATCTGHPNSDEQNVFVVQRNDNSGLPSKLLRAIAAEAQDFIKIEDNYISTLVIRHLLEADDCVRVKCICDVKKLKPRIIDMLDYREMARLLRDAGGRIEIRAPSSDWTHDRIILTESQGWAFSNSIKELFNRRKWSIISRLPDEARIYLDSDFDEMWMGGQPVLPSAFDSLADQALMTAPRRRR